MILESYDKYEYMWPDISGYSLSTIISKFNAWGQEGWEVISFSLDKYQVLLKRKIMCTKVDNL